MSKETLVYVLPTEVIDVNGIDIDIWADYEREGKELPRRAKEFIRRAENNGSVYSLKGFMVAQNISNDINPTDKIFITQAY